MQALYIVIPVLGIFVIAYRYYSAFIAARIMSLDDSGCLCTTMFRISPQHLCWALENLAEGQVVNQIKVKSEVKHWARVALDRMLEIQ